MGLLKYLFNAGDPFPAENAGSIDPENIPQQASGYLTGGSNPSVISVFQTLGGNNNDGKIKINIDGTVHDNVPVDLILPESTATKKIAQETSNSWSNNWQPADGAWQTFNTGNLCRITEIIVGFYSGSSGLATLSLYDENNVLLGSKQVSIGSMNSGSVNTLDFVFASAITVKKNKTYKIVITVQSGSLTISYSSGNPYADGTNGNYPTADMYFQIYGKNDALASLSDVATCLQTAIRTITGKTETVVFSTNHFVITSSIKGRTSKILKLMTPSSGTDISGAGATPYLDCADNATETLGTGIEFLLPRLNGEGVLPVPMKINSQTGTSYTLISTDAFKYVIATNASAITLTIPTNAVSAFPIGTEIYIIQGGAGKITIGGAGITINSLSSYKSISGANGQATLVKVATDTWQLYGNLIA